MDGLVTQIQTCCRRSLVIRWRKPTQVCEISLFQKKKILPFQNRVTKNSYYPSSLFAELRAKATYRSYVSGARKACISRVGQHTVILQSSEIFLKKWIQPLPIGYTDNNIMHSFNKGGFWDLQNVKMSNCINYILNVGN